MADFLSNLWSSVFTPGPTPTLLIATNVSFAALQLLLVGLLVATYSIHFVVLSILSGALWWSINWFATELEAAQQKEEEAEKLRRRKKEDSEWRRKGEVADSADDEGEDTEVEESREGNSRVTEELADAMKPRSGKDGAAASTEQATGGAEIRQRNVEDLDRSGEVSTDSEWEKVSQEGDR